jgi:hypothetical protein
MTTTTHQKPRRRSEIHARLQELVAVRDALADDLDDPHVLSEYTVVEQQIRHVKDLLWPPR